MYLRFVIVDHELSKGYSLWITPAKWQAKAGEKNDDCFINKLGSHVLIDDSCVKALALLVNRTNAKIVLTSTWRKGFTHNIKFCSNDIRQLRNKFNLYGFDIYSRTQDLDDQNLRYKEVEMFVKSHNVGSYIILDDDITLFNGDLDHLYLVNGTRGLTYEDISTVLKRVKKGVFLCI